MYLGRIVENGPTEAVFERPDHPYTAALMSAAPKLDAEQRGERILLKGEVPSPLNPPSGCRFRTRCWKATDICATTTPPPPLDPEAAGHAARMPPPAAPSERARARRRRERRRVLRDRRWRSCSRRACRPRSASAWDARRADRRARRPGADPRHADHAGDAGHADRGGARTRGHRPARAPGGRWPAGCPERSPARCCWCVLPERALSLLLAAVVLGGVVLTSCGWVPVAAPTQPRAGRCGVGSARHRDGDRRPADGAGVAAQHRRAAARHDERLLPGRVADVAGGAGRHRRDRPAHLVGVRRCWSRRRCSATCSPGASTASRPAAAALAGDRGLRGGRRRADRPRTAGDAEERTSDRRPGSSRCAR